MMMGSTRIGVRVLPVGLLFSNCFIIAPYVLSVKYFTYIDLPFSGFESGFYYLVWSSACSSIIPHNNIIVNRTEHIIFCGDLDYNYA